METAATTTIDLLPYAASRADRLDDAVARTSPPSLVVYFVPAIALLGLLVVAEAGSDASRSS